MPGSAAAAAPACPAASQAKKLSEDEGKGDSKTLGEEAVRKELDSLFSALGASVKGVDPEDLK